jgi:hypothetical protein
MMHRTNMKTIGWIIFFASFGLPSIAFPGDKDMLRDACSAIKQASKRSECFDALDRLTAKASAPASPLVAPVGPLVVNARAFGECAALEYAEIDSMPRAELEGLYCSYLAGADVVRRIGDASIAKQANLSIKAALMGDQIRRLERCTAGMTKAVEAFNRKFAGEKADCSKMPGRLAPQPKELASSAEVDGLSDSVKAVARGELLGAGCDPIGTPKIDVEPYKQIRISYQCSGSNRWQSVSCSDTSCRSTPPP